MTVSRRSYAFVIIYILSVLQTGKNARLTVNAYVITALFCYSFETIADKTYSAGAAALTRRNDA